MLTKSWRWFVTRGVIGILFGIVAFVWPGLTWLALVAAFAAYAFLDGIASLFAAFGRDAGERRWGVLLAEGIAGIAVGVLTVVWPARMAVAFVYVVGFWGILTGALEISAAYRLRKLVQHEWLLALAGVLSVVFGIVVWFWPAAGALALVWWIGSYAIVFGALLVGLGLRLRRRLGGRPRDEIGGARRPLEQQPA
jgi:uncharacterized membrane protein HdeD (DUF308 family)